MARFFKLGLIVTGKGEAEFLPVFLRSVASGGNCTLKVLRRIDQRSPRTSAKRTLQVTGTQGRIPDRDEEEIGLPARRHLDGDRDALVVLVDDLERARSDDARGVYRRYREALDAMLGPHFTRASVHFLVNMLEAYYFADAAAVRSALAVELADHEGDVEEIGHPKRRLKAMAPHFDERRDGAVIAGHLDLEHVLRDPYTCGSLRTLVAWCVKQMGQPRSERFALSQGIQSVVTGPQLGDALISLAAYRAPRE